MVVVKKVFRGMSKALFRLEMKNFYVTSDMSEGCRERFLETNKKINYIARLETAR